MQTRPLGRTGLDVSALSIGGLYTSSLAGGVDETSRIVRTAVDLGINAIDTAPAYADSERTVGAALSQLGAAADSLLVTTKLGGRPQPFDAQNIGALRESVRESLRLLGRDRIDVLMIHEPDRPQQYAWWTGTDPLDGPVLTLIDELKADGTIRFAGLAGTTVTELTRLIEDDRAGRFDVVLTAFQYNALVRDAADTIFPAAIERNLGLVAASAYGQGFLTRRADEEVRRGAIWLAPDRRRQLLAYYDLLDQAAMPAYELCLRFALADPRIATVPIGCKTLDQLRVSVAAAAKGPLPPDIAARLDEIAAMVPRRPFEEPMILPLGKTYFGPGKANVGAAVKVGSLDADA